MSQFETRRRLSISSSDKAKTKAMVQKMRQTIDADASLNKEQGWEQLWQDGVTPWDLNRPTPALVSELEASNWKTEKVLVPGCGSAFDLLTIAAHQERLQRAGLVQGSAVVIGLDISLTSLEQAKKVLVREYQPKADSPCISLVHGDFFDCSTWKAIYSSKPEIIDDAKLASWFREEMFDFIFDYVFFCALPPDLRPAWGQAMSSLLKPETGRLLTLMFPVLPNPEMKGPPFPVSVEDYRKVLEPKNVVLESEPYESPHTVPERVGKELVGWWIRDSSAPSKL
jgi:methyl halide transferase